MEIKPYPRGACIISGFPFTTETYDLLTKMPGFSKWEGRDLVFRPTPANVEYLIRYFPDARWLEGTDVHLAALENRNRLAEEIRAGKAHLDLEDNFVYKTKPWDHQRRAFLLSRDLEAFALLMEQRTGKTKVIIDTAAYLWGRGKLHTLIIVSVKGVHRNWIETEIPAHMPEWVDHLDFFSRSSLNKKQQSHLERVLASTHNLRILAFNVESFSGGTGEVFREALGNGKGVMVVIDEATRIKNLGAERSKFLERFGADAEYRRILTGTPYVKDPLDIYGQFHWLDREILGYDTKTAFKKHFCIVKTFEKGEDGKFKMVDPEKDRGHRGGPRFEKFVGIDHADELANLIDGFSYRVLFKNVSDAPGKVYKRYPIEMASEQKKLYHELSKEYIAEFEGHTVSAPMAMTRALRLQQVLSGWWPMEEEELEGGETWRKVRPIGKKNPRMEALMNILRSTEEKVIIWSRFRPDLEAIQKALGPQQCVSYHGGIRDEARARNLRAFQTDPVIKYFVGNPASAGLGLNLSVASLAVFYNNSYDLEQRLQAEDRAQAVTKKFPTLIYDIEVPGTQDTKVIRNLKGKKDLANLITRDPRSFFLESGGEE